MSKAWVGGGMWVGEDWVAGHHWMARLCSAPIAGGADGRHPGYSIL